MRSWASCMRSSRVIASLFFMVTRRGNASGALSVRGRRGTRRKAIHREIKGSDKANGAHAANAAMGRASGIDTLDGRDANEKSSLAFSSEVASNRTNASHYSKRNYGP